MSKRNEAIGEVECPHKGCSVVCKVYRFRERGDSPVSVANRRFAGKLYGDCGKHGRFGGAGSDQATQDYILENAKIWGAKNAGEGREAAPASASETPEKPASAPASKPPAKAPASSQQSTPATPANQQLKGWGFFS